MAATLASIDDLVALGALPLGADVSDGVGERASRLLELAEGAVLTFCRSTVAAITDESTGWAASSQLTLAGIVAEIAGRRLTSPAAPTSAQLGELPPAAFMSVRLTRADRAALLEIPEVAESRSGASAGSLQLTRPNSWHLTVGTTTEDDFA